MRTVFLLLNKRSYYKWHSTQKSSAIDKLADTNANWTNRDEPRTRTAKE